MSKLKQTLSIKILLTGVLIGLLCGTSQVWALSETDFQKVGSQYGVSPYLLIAISVVETRQGRLLGKHEVKKVIGGKQLKFLRKIARHTGRDISEFKGSYAGAMGYMQIVPSTFYTYGQDGDGDGIKDPLNDYDSLATAAYYLAYRIAVNDTLTAAIKNYNNSTTYCEKVLKLAHEMQLESKLASR